MQLTPELLARLQLHGRLPGDQLRGVVGDPGAFGNLELKKRVNDSGWISGAGDDGTPYYNVDLLRIAAGQLGVDPEQSPQALFNALRAANETPGVYTLTQDVANGQFGANTRGIQDFQLDPSGNLIPMGQQQQADLNQNSDWRDFQQSGALNAIGMLAGAYGGGSLAAGATGGAGAAGGAAAAETGLMGAAPAATTAGTAAAGTAAAAGGGSTAAGLTGATGALGTAGSLLNSPVAAAALGAAAGAGGSGNLQTSSTQELPAWLQPYASEYARFVQSVAATPYQTYGGQGVAGLTQDQQSAFDMIRNQAGQSNPLNQASQDLNIATMRGDFLNPESNPYLASTFDQAAKRVTDAYGRSSAMTNAAFHDAGSHGSTGHQALVESNNRAFGDSLANLGNQIYGQNYQQERTRQATTGLQAPNLAGTMQSNAYRNAEALMGAGAMQQQNQQDRNNFDYQEFMRRQQFPAQQANIYGGLFGRNMGSTATSTQPGISTTQGLLGGAAAGLGLYRQYQGLLGNSTQQPSGPTNA